MDKLLCEPFPGGSELGETLYVGRTRANGELIVGKVFPKHSAFRGLWLPFNGCHNYFEQFEILLYNCNIPSITPNKTFDYSYKILGENVSKNIEEIFFNKL